MLLEPTIAALGRELGFKIKKKLKFRVHTYLEAPMLFRAQGEHSGYVPALARCKLR